MPSSKPFTVLTCAQRSPEWYAAKCGVFSGSMADDAFAKTKVKGEWTAKRKDLRVRLALERLTNRVLESTWLSKDMLTGIEREAAAIRAYENLHGVLVRAVGFVLDNELPIGCSPDGVIGEFEGGVEAKCPKASTHLATLRAYHAVLHQPIEAVAANLSLLDVIPEEYRYQVRHNLYVTGASWWDFCSYEPSFPPPLRMVTIRVTRDDAKLADYESLVRAFLTEVDAEGEQIAEMMR